MVREAGKNCFVNEIKSKNELRRKSVGWIYRVAPPTIYHNENHMKKHFQFEFVKYEYHGKNILNPKWEPTNRSSINWAFQLVQIDNAVFLQPRFGKALSSVRTRHTKRMRAIARKCLKHNLTTYKSVKRNTRSDSKWTKWAHLSPVFDYLA